MHKCPCIVQKKYIYIIREGWIVQMYRDTVQRQQFRTVEQDSVVCTHIHMTHVHIYVNSTKAFILKQSIILIYIYRCTIDLSVRLHTCISEVIKCPVPSVFVC